MLESGYLHKIKNCPKLTTWDPFFNKPPLDNLERAVIARVINAMYLHV